MAGPSAIDFFISYRTSDESWAAWIAWNLEEAGYSTFLQAWDFRPGSNFVAQMQKGATECARTIVVLTPTYFLSGFARAEWCAAFAHDPTGEQGLLLPVRVSECDVEGLLGSIIFINLVGLDQASARERLLAGVSRSRAKPLVPPSFPGGQPSGRPRPGFPGANPYRGLEAFRAEHRGLFKGRQRYVQAVAKKLQAKRLVAIIGASGSGKSSLALAGVLPRLEDEGWLTAEFRPLRDPYSALAHGLIKHLEPSLSDVGPMWLASEHYARIFRDEPRRLADATSVLLKHSGKAGLLILADQFDELFSQVVRTDRIAFIDLISTSCENPEATIRWLVTLRADFLEQALQSERLTELLQDADVKLGPMNVEELRSAIIEPAAMQGVRFSEGLPQRLIEDAIGPEQDGSLQTLAAQASAGRLPLLQFALQQLWDRQRDGQIPHDAYDDPARGIGGVHGALRRHAETAFAQLDEKQKLRASRLFRRLVQRGAGANDVRRIVQRAEVDSDWDDLVRPLANARLLTTSESSSEHATVEVIHEELLRAWPQLKEWIAENRQFDDWRQGLTEQATQWQGAEDAEKPDFLLRGGSLDKALVYVAERSAELTAGEQAFVEASRLERSRVEDEKRAAQTRRTRNTRLIAAFTTCLAALAIVAALFARDRADYALRQEKVAKELQQTAQQERDLARARELAAKATLALSGSNVDPSRSALLAVESLRRMHTLEGYDAWTAAMSLLPRGVVRLQHREPVSHLAFSPDGATLATAASTGSTAAGQAQLWDLATGQPLATIEHAGWVVAAGFSSDGKLLATASGDRTVVIADAETGQEIRRLTREDAVSALTFSHHGKILAVGEKDGTISLVDISSGSNLVRFKHRARVTHMAFRSDDRRMVAASEDKLAVVWDAESGEETARRAVRGELKALAFGSSGAHTVVGAADEVEAQLLDVETGGVLASLSKDDGGLNHAAFTPDGNRLIASGYDKDRGNRDTWVGIWDAASGGRIAGREHDRPFIYHMAVTRDGALVAIADAEGQVSLWEVATGRERFRLPHDDDVTAVAFSPDGRSLVTASKDQLVRVWDASSGQELKRLQHDGRTDQLAFSPDGRRLLTTTRLSEAKEAWGEVALWSVSDWRETARVARLSLGIGDVAFSRDGKTIVTPRSDGSLRVLDSGSGEESSKVPVEEASSIWPTPDENRWIVDGEVWDLRERNRLASLSDPGGVSSVSFDRGRRLVATQGYDETFRIWDATTGKELHRSRDGCCLSADGTTYLTDEAGVLEVRSIASGEVRARLAHGQPSLSFKADPSHLRVAAIDASVEISLWDIAAQKIIAKMSHPYIRPAGQRPYTGEPTRLPIVLVEFSADGRRLATSSPIDGRVYLWDASSGQLIRRLDSRIAQGFTPFAFSGDSRLLATVEAESRLTSVWDAETGDKIRDIEIGGELRTKVPVFSPDGTSLALGVGSGVEVWDVARGRRLFELPGGSVDWPVSKLAFSPSGALLAIGTFDSRPGIGIWDLRSGKEQLRLHPGAGIEELAFAADEVLMTHDRSDIARAWDLRAGSEIYRFAHVGSIQGVSYAADGGRVATWNEALLQVWDSASGARIAEVRQDGRIELLAISPDGSRLATLEDADFAVDVFEVETAGADGEPPAVLFKLRHDDYVRTLSFSADGTLIVTGSRDGTVRLWVAQTGVERTRLAHDGDVEETLLNDDSSVLAAVVARENRRQLHLWHVPTARRFGVWPIEEPTEMAFRPASRTLAVATGEQVVRVFEAQPAGPEVARTALGGAASTIAINPEGTMVAVGRGEAREAELREVATGKTLFTIAHDDHVWDVAFTPDGTRLASRGKDQTTRLWDVQTGGELLRLTPPEGNQSLRFSPDGRRLLIVRPQMSEEDEGKLQIVDVGTGSRIGLPIYGYGFATAFSPDSRYLAVGEGDYSSTANQKLGFFGARVFDADDGSELLRLPHEEPVGGVAFGPDGTLLATQPTIYDQPVRLWDVTSGTAIAKIGQPPLGEAVRSIAFSPNGEFLAARTETEIGVWRLTDLTAVARLPHEVFGSSFSFGPDGRLIAAVARDEALVWDWAKQRPLLRLYDVRGYSGEVQFTPDGGRLVAIHKDDTIRVWALRADDMIADACSRLERNFTREEWRSFMGVEAYRPTCDALPVPEN